MSGGWVDVAAELGAEYLVTRSRDLSGDPLMRRLRADLHERDQAAEVARSRAYWEGRVSGEVPGGWPGPIGCDCAECQRLNATRAVSRSTVVMTLPEQR